MRAGMIFQKEPFFHGHDNYDQLVKIAKVRIRTVSNYRVPSMQQHRPNGLTSAARILRLKQVAQVLVAGVVCGKLTPVLGQTLDQP